MLELTIVFVLYCTECMENRQQNIFFNNSVYDDKATPGPGEIHTPEKNIL